MISNTVTSYTAGTQSKALGVNILLTWVAW